MQPDALIALVQGGSGALVMAAFFIVAFIRGWIVPGLLYDDLRLERDYWRSVADRALTVAEKVAPTVLRNQP